MKPWTLIERASVPGSSSQMELFSHDGAFVIRVDREELMTSRAHGSEEELAELTCAAIAERPAPRVLIGGLGMGFTLARTLQRLSSDAQVVVSELVPAVVRWNRGPLAHVAERPLFDPRVEVVEGDVSDVIRGGVRRFDAILLDVDNGPNGLTRASNDWLYGTRGVKTAFAALDRGGVLGVWSAGHDDAFTRRLESAGFSVELIPVRARGKRGARHYIWIATRQVAGRRR